MVEQTPFRGYLSSVGQTLNFGLGDIGKVDSLKIFWPNGYVQTEYNLRADSVYTFKQEDSDFIVNGPPVPAERPVMFSVTPGVSLNCAERTRTE